MLDRLLNRLANIKRYSNIKNTSGDVSNNLVNIATSVKVRITTNKRSSFDYGNQTGVMNSSSHLIFCKPIIGITIEVGDVVEDTVSLKKYKIDYIDDLPGGVDNSHWQIYATIVEP